MRCEAAYLPTTPNARACPNPEPAIHRRQFSTSNINEPQAFALVLRERTGRIANAWCCSPPSSDHAHPLLLRRTQREGGTAVITRLIALSSPVRGKGSAMRSVFAVGVCVSTIALALVI